jgi:hypothetical protein
MGQAGCVTLISEPSAKTINAEWLPELRLDVVDLPRFRGRFRAWDQCISFDVILSSSLVHSFVRPACGAILSSRPAGYARRRDERRSRSACTQAVRSGSVSPGRALTTVSTLACLGASGSSAIREQRCS